MDDYFLTEDSIIDVDVYDREGFGQHYTLDAVNMIESGVTFNDMLAEFKSEGATKVVIEVVF